MHLSSAEPPIWFCYFIRSILLHLPCFKGVFRSIQAFKSHFLSINGLKNIAEIRFIVKYLSQKGRINGKKIIGFLSFSSRFGTGFCFERCWSQLEWFHLKKRLVREIKLLSDLFQGPGLSIITRQTYLECLLKLRLVQFFNRSLKKMSLFLLLPKGAFVDFDIQLIER